MANIRNPLCDQRTRIFHQVCRVGLQWISCSPHTGLDHPEDNILMFPCENAGLARKFCNGSPHCYYLCNALHVTFRIIWQLRDSYGASSLRWALALAWELGEFLLGNACENWYVRTRSRKTWDDCLWINHMMIASAVMFRLTMILVILTASSRITTLVEDSSHAWTLLDMIFLDEEGEKSMIQWWEL